MSSQKWVASIFEAFFFSDFFFCATTPFVTSHSALTSHWDVSALSSWPQPLPGVDAACWNIFFFFFFYICKNHKQRSKCSFICKYFNSEPCKKFLWQIQMCVSFKPPLWRGAGCPGGLHSSHLFTRSVFRQHSSSVSGRQPACGQSESCVLSLQHLNPSLAVHTGGGLLAFTPPPPTFSFSVKEKRSTGLLSGRETKRRDNRIALKSGVVWLRELWQRGRPEAEARKSVLSFVPASFIPSSSGTFPPRHPDSSFILASNFCACLRPGALGILLSFGSHSHSLPYSPIFISQFPILTFSQTRSQQPQWEDTDLLWKQQERG